MDTDFSFVSFGLLANKIRSTVEQAAETVKVTSLQLAEDVKEKSKPLTDSIAENADVVKNKSLELAGTVKEKSSEMADSVMKGAVAVAENVQGRIAPKTVKREGFLAKQVNGSKWIEYYFSIRDGYMQVHPTKDGAEPELSVALDCIQRSEPLDIVVTGKPYCFRVILKLIDREDTIVNNWSFIGTNTFSSNKVNNQEVDVILQATTEDEMNGWVRELYSTSSGLAMQDQVIKTGSGVKTAATTTAYSFMGTLSNFVGYRSEAEVQEENNTP